MLVAKSLPANAGDIKDMGLIPRLRRSHGGENGNHSSIFARIIPWITMGLQSRTQLKVLSMHTHSQREGLRVQQLVAGTVPADGSIQSVALHMSYKPEGR